MISDAIAEKALNHELTEALLLVYVEKEHDLARTVDRLHRALDLPGMDVPDPEERTEQLKGAARAKVRGDFREWYLAQAGVANADRLVVNRYASRDELIDHLASEARELGIDDEYSDEQIAEGVARAHFETELEDLVALAVDFDESTALQSCLVGGLARAENRLDEAIAAVEDDGAGEGSDDAGEGSEDAGEGSEDAGGEDSEDAGGNGEDR